MFRTLHQAVDTASDTMSRHADTSRRSRAMTKNTRNTRQSPDLFAKSSLLLVASAYSCLCLNVMRRYSQALTSLIQQSRCRTRATQLSPFPSTALPRRLLSATATISFPKPSNDPPKHETAFFLDMTTSPVLIRRLPPRPVDRTLFLTGPHDRSCRWRYW